MKNRFGFFLLTLLCCIGVSVLTAKYIVKSQNNFRTIAKEESVYDRVLRTGKIRCAYISSPPYLFKDPNTGKLSGIFVESMDRAATLLQLKVDWVEEVTWGTMSEGLINDRYDAVCSGIWQNSTRARVVDFSIPLFFSAVNAYTRSDETRIVDATALNSSDVRIATIDGEMAEMIAHSSYPKAKLVALPQSSGVAQMLMTVTTGKADVALVQASVAGEFLKHNPGQLKNLTPGKPVRVFGNTIIFKQGQQQFKVLLDTALNQLLNSGEIDELIEKYEPTPEIFYPAAYPYRKEQR